ncbi:hypothetical protein LTS14_005021 [Recurvomyces mirabilis]|nr:hypothetical protein LTS14_005021 [Recurvomyces mirabilis]
MSVDKRAEGSVYLYQPSHVLPIIFSILVGLSWLGHIYQNFRYKAWRITFFMVWGGSVFTAGWVCRAISSFQTTSSSLYMAQTILLYAGPPIYSAAEYSVLGRLMYHLPMYAPFDPGHVTLFFIYLGAAVEALAAAGAAYIGANRHTTDISIFITGGKLLSASLLLQAVLELFFIIMVAYLHRRASRDGLATRNVRTLCIMLYGTSTFVLLRCTARAIESFGTQTVTHCTPLCRILLFHEWFLYVFEAAPMVIYTYWINFIHPGRLLPKNKKCYLDPDGTTERLGPGWIDKRARASRWTDLLDIRGLMNNKRTRDAFWLRPDEWPVVPESSLPDIRKSSKSVQDGRG